MQNKTTQQIKSLTVIFDERCSFCVRCAHWLKQQAQYFPIRLLASNSAEVKQQFPQLASRCSQELFAIDDQRGVYSGNDAWIICLYALKDYRLWSERLSNPILRPWAKKIYQLVSSNRKGISKWLFGMGDKAIINQLQENNQRDIC